MKETSVRELKELIDQGDDPTLIDVRTPVEYRSIHVSLARNVPLDEIGEDALNGIAAKEDRVYVMCQAGGRSAKAYEKLESLGYSNLVNVVGGMNAWTEQGFSAVEGKKALSIERQVRIAAGSLVILGVVLSLLVHVGFIGISAFVGAGLVFAGITDTCGMGLMLARMPWNR